MIRILLLVPVTAALFSRLALAQESTPATDTIRQAELVITPRFNSAGHFPFTGSLINRQVNFDVNVFYEYRNYGFFIFKSFDLEDRNSIVNYLQPGIFRRFDLSPKFQVRVFLGYLFSQISGFSDPDSDYYTAAVGYLELTDKLRLENTVLYFDIVQSGKLANRMLLAWTVKKFRLDLFLWHRVAFEKSHHATSTSVAINFPRIRISDKVSIQNIFSYQGYLTEAKPDFARRDGFLFSIAFPLELQRAIR